MICSSNNYVFGSILFGIILVGGILSYPSGPAGQAPADDNNKVVPFVIDDESFKADDGSELINHGSDESISQPENQPVCSGMQLPQHRPFVRCRPVLSTFKMLKNIHSRWHHAFKNRHRWIQFERVNKKAPAK